MDQQEQRVNAVREALRSASQDEAASSGCSIGLTGTRIEHLDITCDGCDEEPITGSRFKCLACEDIDLCGRCMRALVAARIKSAAEAGPLPPPAAAAGARPRKWVSKLYSRDGAAKWRALQLAVPCLHPSHKFTKVADGPERQLVWRPAAGAGPEECQRFLDTFPPSATACADCAWLVVEAPAAPAAAGASGEAGPSLEDRVDAAVEEWEALVGEGGAQAAKPTAADVDAIARRHGILKGKWLLFPKTPVEADAAWAAVVAAVAGGALCPSAKVSSISPEEAGHVLAAYTSDYLDGGDVMRVAAALQRALPPLTDRRMLYKPDILTFLGIYGGNPYGIKPTVHRASL